MQSDIKYLLKNINQKARSEQKKNNAVKNRSMEYFIWCGVCDGQFKAQALYRTHGCFGAWRILYLISMKSNYRLQFVELCFFFTIVGKAND